MYSGQIQSRGPRYCPSIEDKVVRFAEKERHQIFVEPEGLDHPWLYLNGMSTSLPRDVQDGVVRSLPGFQNAKIARYGYAVEYDFVEPQQLKPSLEVKDVKGLFLAGQINGTSGYEEAAAQGFMAGWNAANLVKGEEPVVLRRDQAYIGVMIDDLVTQGTTEPYRMFTSRAEYRLLLGCDSVYERLSLLAMQHGLLDEERLLLIEQRLERVARAERACDVWLTPDARTRAWLSSAGLSLQGPTHLASLFQQSGFDLSSFLSGAEEHLPLLAGAFRELRRDEVEQVEGKMKYAGYLERQRREAERCRDDEQLRIPESMNFSLPGLSSEVIEKLSTHRPHTLGQARRISGVTPAAISLLRLHLYRQAHG